MSDANDRFLTIHARARYANMAITMVAIGISLFMTVYSFVVFMEAPVSQRKGRKRYIGASIMITILVSFGGSLDIANAFHPFFRSTSPSHWQELVASDYFQSWRFLATYIAVALFMLIGDLLLVYRCYIICLNYWWVTIPPMMMSLCAPALLIVATSRPRAPTSYPISVASFFLTVATNIFVTACITFRLLRARRALAKLLPSADVQVYTGIITILVESAAPLTVCGIISAVLQQLDGVTSIGESAAFRVCNSVAQALFFSFCALSPQLIIFRVTTGRSFTQFPTPKDGVLSQPIHFAHGTVESSFLHSTFNRESGRNSNLDTEVGLNQSADGFVKSQASVSDVEQEKRHEVNLDAA